MVTSVCSWDPLPNVLMLGRDEVHVWRASLDMLAPCVQSLLSTLSEDERARAKRFYFKKDRSDFLVARGLLRAILGRYLDMQPSQLRFCYSPYRKPALAEESGGDVLKFNLSHSHGLVLVAVTCGREIGIDLELVRPEVASEQIAERFFSPREVAVFRALPANLKHEAFFTCWTRKEAYVKAKGDGLSIPLDQFDVSLAPEEPAALLSTKWDPKEVSRWSLQELHPGPTYVGALAVEGHNWRLKCWQWP